jgi:hypothetical protein
MPKKLNNTFDLSTKRAFVKISRRVLVNTAYPWLAIISNKQRFTVMKQSPICKNVQKKKRLLCVIGLNQVQQ